MTNGNHKKSNEFSTIKKQNRFFYKMCSMLYPKKYNTIKKSCLFSFVFNRIGFTFKDPTVVY